MMGKKIQVGQPQTMPGRRARGCVTRAAPSLRRTGQGHPSQRRRVQSPLRPGVNTQHGEPGAGRLLQRGRFNIFAFSGRGGQEQDVTR